MIPATPSVQIRFGLGVGFGNVLVLGDSGNGILGTNVLGTAQNQTVDISNLVQRIAIRRGRDRVFEEYSPGRATIRFIDRTGDWNPENTSGPYYGQILPMRQVKIAVTYNSTPYSLFTGFIQSWDWEWDTVNSIAWVTIQATDAFRILNLANVTTVTGAANDDLPGVRVNQILNTIGWPSSLRQIDNGAVQLQNDPGTSRTALGAIQTVEQTELGGFYIDGDGKATFRSRVWFSQQAIGVQTFAPTRTNHVTNPSFEINTTDWAGSAATVSQVTTDAYIGTASLQAISTTTSSGSVAWMNPTRPTAVAGQTWTGSAYLRNTAGTTRSLKVALQWIDSVGTILSTTSGTAISKAPGDPWARFSVTGTAPANTATVRLLAYVQNSNAQIGNTILVDGVLLEQSSTLQPYFDGSTNYTPSLPYTNVNVAWTGTANASTSTANEYYFAVTDFNDDGTGIDYQTLDVAFDDTELSNSVTVTRESGAPQTATDSTSISNYFLRSYNRSGLMMRTNNEALAQANAILNYRKTPRLRVDSIGMELVGSTSRIATGLGLDIGDPIHVHRTMPGGSRINVLLLVQGVNHDITPDRWFTTFTTAYPLSTAFILGDATYGVLGTSTL